MMEAFVMSVMWGVTGIISIIVGLGLIVVAAALTYAAVSETLKWVQYYVKTSDDRVSSWYERKKKLEQEAAKVYREEIQNKGQEEEHAFKKRTDI